jgi:hypothetical protein
MYFKFSLRERKEKHHHWICRDLSKLEEVNYVIEEVEEVVIVKIDIPKYSTALLDD